MSDSLFRDRRSIKPRDMDPARPIERDLLDEIFLDAHHAPTHGLTQPWRFHVFSGKARSRLASALWEIYGQVVPPAEQKDEKRAKLLESPVQAAACVALLASIAPDGPIPEWEEIAATSCAAQNLMLSAHAKGIATFWSSSPAARSQEFVRWLGAQSPSQKQIPMGIIYMGYALRKPAAPARNPLSKHVFHLTE